MKKIVKWAGYIILPIVILLLVGILQWQAITYFALRKVVQFYAGREHIIFEAGAISGRPFSHTTFENVGIRPDEGQQQVFSFKAESVACTYNLWDLKKGYEFFLQGLSCSVQTPELFQDFSLSMAEDEAETELKTFLLPAVLPRLDVYNGTIILTGTGWGVDIRQVNSHLQSPDAIHELQLDAGGFSFSQQDETKINTSFTAMLRYSGTNLSIDSFKISEDEISATGNVDLARIDEKYVAFGVDLAFAESLLNIAGSLNNKLLKAEVSSQNFDIGELQQRLGGTGWDLSGKIKAEAELAADLGTPADMNGSFVIDVLDGRLHGVDIEAFSAAGRFGNGVFSVSLAEAGLPGNHVLIKDVTVPMSLLQTGEIFSILGQTDAEFSVNVADVFTLLKFTGIEDNVIPELSRLDSLKILGHLGKGSLYLEEVKVVAADSSLTIDNATIPLPATREALDSIPIKLTARLETADVKSLSGLFVDIPVTGPAAADMSITGSMEEPKGEITLKGENLRYNGINLGSLVLQGDIQLILERLGSIRSVQFSATRLTQVNDFGTLALLSPIAGTWQQQSFSMRGALQIDGQGEVAISVVQSQGKETKAEISTSNLASDGWLANFIGKRYFFHGADMNAVFAGHTKNPNVHLTGIIKEVGGAGMDFPLTGRFKLQYSSKGIEISEFSWRSLERNQLTVKGFLPYDPLAPEPFQDGALALEGHIDFPTLEDIAVFLEPLGIRKGSVALDASLSGSWQQPVGHIMLKAEGVDPPDTIKQYTDAPMDLSCDLAAASGSIILNAASLESSDYEARATGSWQHGLAFKELLQKNRTTLKGDIKADATARLKNLNFFKKMFPWLLRFDGNTQVNLHASGPISDPVLQGSFSLKDGEISHTFNLPMLSEVNMESIFDGHSLTITSMQAEVGGSPVSLNGRISRMQEGIDVNLHLEGNNVLLLRNNDMRLRGNVQLAATGPLDRLAISGTTALTGGYYSRNIDFLGKIGASTTPVSEGGTFLFSFVEQPLKNAVFNIKITTIEPFRIRNNLIRSTLRPELFLKGTGELPFLVGTVYIDPSRVLLPSGRLQVQSGLVRFLENDPDRPQLDLLAHSKVMGYEINVVTQGPLDDPVITLSSSPALPNDDLLLLLLTGQPPKDEDVTSTGLGRGATNVMVYLGRDFLNKWLEDESGASDETILDRFELDYGRAVTKSGEQTIESTFRLSEQTSGEKRIYYLAGEKDKYDAYNYGLRVVFSFE